MTEFAVTGGLSLGLLILAGACVLALVPPRLRPGLTPAVPALGAVALILVLHFTALVWPTATTSGFLLVAVLAGSVVALPRLRGLPRWCIRMAAATLVMGLALGAFALLPALELGHATVVVPGAGDDAHAFVTLADWFQHHRLTQTPRLGVDSAAYGYVLQHQHLEARVGQDLLQGTFASILGKDPAKTWYTVTCLWLVLLPGAVVAAGLSLFRSRVTALVAGVTVGCSAIVVGQAFNQNSASLLGIAIAPLALTGIATRLGGPERRWPLWLSAAALGALLGAYSEYAAVLAPAVTLLVVFRPRVIKTAAALAGATLLIAPTEAYRGVRSLAHNLDGSFFPRVGSPFSGVTPWMFINRVTGATSRIPIANASDGHRQTYLALVVLMASAAALVLAILAARPFRALWFAVAVSTCGMVAYLAVIRHFPYGEQRAIEISLPLVVLCLAAGLETAPALLVGLAQRLGSALRVSVRELRQARRGAPWLAGVPLAAVIVAAVTVNLGTSAAVATSTLSRDQQVTGEFLTAASWLARVGGPAGRDAIIVDSDPFSERWLAYASRRLPDLSYAFMEPADSGLEPSLPSAPSVLWDGRPRHWAVIGDGEFVAAGTPVVDRAGRFRLVDLSRPNALVMTPIANFYDAESDHRGGVFHWFGDDPELLLVGGCSGERAHLLVEARSDLTPVAVVVRTATMTRQQPVATIVTRIPVKVQPHGAVAVGLHNLRPAITSGSDPRRLSLRVLGVECS